jgi:hypothetical protein
MRYVIYNTKTGMSKERFSTQRGAKIALAALRRKEAKYPENQQTVYGIMPEDQYESNVNIMVERINFMTGATFMERLDTPYHCSPSSETYWST